MSTNRAKREELYSKYGEECMCTGTTTDLTYHHIQKAEYGGPTTILNGSVLSSASQAWLHNYIENTDQALYDLVNECLLLYKMAWDQGKVDIVEQWKQEIIPEFVARIVTYSGKSKKAKGKVYVKKMRR